MSFTLHNYSTNKNSAIMLLNDKVVITHFETSDRQLFETEEGSFVYYKDEQKLYKLELESYTKLLIKLQDFIKWEIIKKENKSIC